MVIVSHLNLKESSADGWILRGVATAKGPVGRQKQLTEDQVHRLDMISFAWTSADRFE